jgi:hypothetical protein
MEEKENMLLEKSLKHFTQFGDFPLQKFFKTTLREVTSDFSEQRGDDL